VEKLFATLGHRDRLRIVFWLLRHGPARQVEILRRLSDYRGKPVNPGEVSGLIKPLLDAGVLLRARPRGPIEIRDPQQLARLLQTGASLSSALAAAGNEEARRDSDDLRRALLHELSDADADADG